MVEIPKDETSSPWKRNRRTAILLAIFLGPWTWIYTFKKNAWKATVSLGICISLFILFIELYSVAARDGRFSLPDIIVVNSIFAIWLIVSFITWLWAIIDTSLKKDEWYQIVNTSNKSKAAAIVIAVFLGLWTWFYTYERDYRYFWASIVAGIILVYFSLFTNNGPLIVVTALFFAFIWVASMVVAITRLPECYQSFPEKMKKN